MRAVRRWAGALGRAAPAALCDLAGLAGAGLVARGAWIYSEPLGFIVAGGLLMTAAALLARRMS